MNRLILQWQLWAPVFQMSGWLMFMGWITFGGYDTAYLASLQSTLLRAGWWLMLIILITQAWQNLSRGAEASTCHHHDHDHQQGPPQPIKLLAVSAVHFVPWLLFWITGVTTLTLQQEQNLRFSTIRVQGAEQSNIQGFDPASLASGQRVDVNLIDIYSHEALKSGAHVKVVGRLMRLNAQQVQQYKPGHQGNMSLLYRYAIACCAADASPIGLLLEDPQDMLKGLVKDAWLEMEGTTSNTIEGEEILGLTVTSVKPTSAPKQPYLFWLAAIP
ncbi:TIGR03943 family putative permease subunit [Magnetococcus sp. PR-3]|uniref:TIGR03943 family putative permease subunit n=1 Tax=Magnetococcus sp. PR-3 TaxID=3120355 RepID=UPI002FCE0C93